jgi:hypothetical protein
VNIVVALRHAGELQAYVQHMTQITFSLSIAGINELAVDNQCIFCVSNNSLRPKHQGHCRLP